MQVTEHVLERKGVRRVERQDQSLFGRGGLQLEVESLAELLAQRESPRLVDAAAEWRVKHELHSARLVEETLERDGVDGRHHAEASLGLAEIDRDLRGRRARQEILAHEELNGVIE